MTEVWKENKEIPGYEVSNLGKVRSLNYMRTGIVKEMRQRKAQNGYFSVQFYVNSKRTWKSVHRMVCCTFNDIPLNDNRVVMHLNDDKADNRLENLKIGTHKENSIDASLKGRLLSGEDNKASKLMEADVIEIRDRYKSGGVSHKHLSEEYEVTESCIYSILNNITWKKCLKN